MLPQVRFAAAGRFDEAPLVGKSGSRVEAGLHAGVHPGRLVGR
jgi:hypothetical protein